MHNIVIIDGLCLLFRSFFAIKDMTNRENQNIAGIYGFARELISVIKNTSPTHIAVALDTGKKTWRHELLDTYKAHRKKSPPELSHQFSWIRDLCNICGLYIYEQDGYEADDLIASCAKQYGKDHKMMIITYDKDLYQLVNDNVSIYHPFKGSILKTKDVEAKFGVHPSQIADFLALTGDQVDGIIGISGIGPKTASTWLQEYSSIEGIVKNIDALKPASRGKILKDNIHKLQIARDLVCLKNDLDVGDIDQKRLIYQCPYAVGTFLKKIGLENLLFDFENTICSGGLFKAVKAQFS